MATSELEESIYGLSLKEGDKIEVLANGQCLVGVVVRDGDRLVVEAR